MFVAVYLQGYREPRTPYQDLQTITGEFVGRVAGNTPLAVLTLEEHHYERGDRHKKTTEYHVPHKREDRYNRELWHFAWEEVTTCL